MLAVVFFLENNIKNFKRRSNGRSIVSHFILKIKSPRCPLLVHNVIEMPTF